MSNIEQLLSYCDIVEVISKRVSLRQRGSSYVGLCPFHMEKTPSFSVSRERQLYHCFGCGESGNAIGFVMKTENLPFLDAARKLADSVNFTLDSAAGFGYAQKKETQKKIFAINAAAARFFYDNLNSENGKKARAYLGARQIGESVRKRFGLGGSFYQKNALLLHLREKGFDEAAVVQSGLAVKTAAGALDRFFNRVMFPIFSPFGEITGFGGRVTGDGEPKYLNSPETPVFDKRKNLYGINFVRLAKARSIILTEGYIDVISLHQAGFKNAAAALGTAVTGEHARLIKQYASEVVLVLDSDAAGQRAAARAIPIFIQAGLPVRVLVLSGAKDPDEFIRTNGRAAFEEKLEAAPDAYMFQINSAAQKYDLTRPDGKSAFAKEAAEAISLIESDAEKSIYAKEIAQIADVPFGAVLSETKRAARGGPRYIKAAPEKTDASVTVNAQIAAVRAAAFNPEARRVLKNAISSAHFTDPVCAALFGAICRFGEGASVSPGALLSVFPEYAEQKKAAQIMSGADDTPCDEKHLTQIIKGCLIGHYGQKAREAAQNGQINALNDLLSQKRLLDGINVSFSNADMFPKAT